MKLTVRSVGFILFIILYTNGIAMILKNTILANFDCFLNVKNSLLSSVNAIALPDFIEQG